ncbi:hypothetical protein L9F63_008673, partial [Diploptera punctata]
LDTMNDKISSEFPQIGSKERNSRTVIIRFFLREIRPLVFIEWPAEAFQDKPKGPIAENELTADLSVMHESRRFRNIGNELPRILSDKTTSVIFVCYRGMHLCLHPANNTLNSLVDSIKFLFSVYTEKHDRSLQ